MNVSGEEVKSVGSSSAGRRGDEEGRGMAASRSVSVSGSDAGSGSDEVALGLVGEGVAVPEGGGGPGAGLKKGLRAHFMLMPVGRYLSDAG